MRVERNQIKNKTIIMVFGTFDMIHKGHESLFRQARRLARHPFLVVSIARDANVKRVKGKKPRNNERVRLKFLTHHHVVDKAVLGGIKNYLAHIKKEAPDIIALGYDQKAYTETLKADLKAAGLSTKVVRLKAYYPKKYKTSLLMK